MHFSLSAESSSPRPLDPKINMPPNSPCWCGSSLKWKKCHRDREKQQAEPIGKLFADHRTLLGQGYCLHPEAGDSTCGDKIIRAHTVQRRGGLAAIAEKGHVISPKSGFAEIYKNDGKIIPRLLGVSNASTFMGFCNTHDNALFAPLEKFDFHLTKEAAFLLSFRSICYELFVKKAQLKGSEHQRIMDKGQPFFTQVQIQQGLHLYRFRIRRGLANIEEWKTRYDAAFASKDLTKFSFYAVKFSSPLPLVACGAFYPEFDFSGKPLQIITRGNGIFESICFNLTVVQDKSLVVLGWTGEPNGPAEQFFNSFRKLPKDDLANITFHFACEYFENIYFHPSWWDAQSAPTKDYLIKHFCSGMPNQNPNRQIPFLSRIKQVFSSAKVEEEVFL